MHDAKNDANGPINVSVNLTVTQRNILDLITQNPNITHTEIAEVLSITEMTTRRTAKALRELRRLHREGRD